MKKSLDDNKSCSKTHKVAVDILLDADVIAKFRSNWPDWESKINEVLKDKLASHSNI